MYSWYTTLASSPPFTWRNASGANGQLNRYICVRGRKPSGGVLKLALSMWLPSGIPVSTPPMRCVFAPSSASASTGSPASPWPVELTSWKLPAASVKPIGAASRWSWNVLTKKYTCVPFCFRFMSHENAPSGKCEFHEHGYAAEHGELVVFVNGVNA